MTYEEAPEVVIFPPTEKIGSFSVYPYARFEDARGNIDSADQDLGELGGKFHIRRFRDGYVLANDRLILDARCFEAGDKGSPLEQSVKVFHKVIKESQIVS